MATPRKTILLITDNVAVGSVASRFLRKRDLIVLNAEDKESALLLLDLKPVNLVLLDDIGAGKVSLDILYQIRNSQRPSLPVVMAGSLDWPPEIEQKAKDLGVLTFIFDPFADLPDLHRRIVELLDTRTSSSRYSQTTGRASKGPRSSSSRNPRSSSSQNPRSSSSQNPRSSSSQNPRGSSSRIPVQLRDKTPPPKSTRKLPPPVSSSVPKSSPSLKTHPPHSRTNLSPRPATIPPRPSKSKTQRPSEPPRSSIPKPRPSSVPQIIDEKLEFHRDQIPGSGLVAEHDVAKLICFCFAERISGLLYLQNGAIEKRIFLKNGEPFYIDSAVPEETLGAHLVRSERISQHQLDDIEHERQTTGKKHGEILLDKGFLSPHELFESLTEHLTAKLISCFAWFEGSFSVQPGVRHSQGVIPLKLDVSRLILDGIRTHYKSKRLFQLFPVNNKTVVYARDGADKLWSKLKLRTIEARLLECARNRTVIGEIDRKGLTDENELFQILYAMYLMEQIGVDFKGTMLRKTSPVPRRNSPIPRRTSPIPQRLSPLPERFSPLPSGASPVPGKTSPVPRVAGENAVDLLDELKQLENADYFILLGLDKDAPTEEVHKAFRERVKRFHPDKLHQFSSDVQKRGAEVYRRLVEGYQVLADPNRRSCYLQECRGTSPPPVRPSRSSQVIEEKESVDPTRRKIRKIIKDAQKAIDNGEFSQAVSRLNAARKVHQNAPKLTAWFGWALYLLNPAVNIHEAERLLTSARSENPDLVDPYLLMAKLREQEGAYRQALDLYKMAASRAPGNEKLIEELNEFEARRRQKPTPIRGSRTPPKQKKVEARDRSSKSPNPKSKTPGSDDGKGLLDQDVGEIFKRFFKKKS